jgi:hypothetical protein
MADAASGSLSEARRGEFDEHIGDCVACRAEFARIESLLGRIDQSLRAELAVEPSPKLVLSVRESIAAEETQKARLAAGWLGWNSWLSAAGVCAVVVALLIFMVAHRANRPDGHFAAHPQIANAAPARVPEPPRRSASAENTPLRAPAHVREIKPRLAFARRESPRIPAHQSTEPEVIVQPGQMQAILQFVAEMQKGKVNGTEIEEGMKAAEKPLEIKPLNIAPLETSQGGTNEDPAAKSRAPGSPDGRSE